MKITTRIAPLALLLLIALPASHARAQSPGIDAQSLAIERQLLCPQCTNLRLDVCDTQLCADMRAEIRGRITKGESAEQIITSFTDRYGVRVLADVPARGFNRLLFAWVIGAILSVGIVGGWVLVRMRRATLPAPANPDDERWLDEQLAAEDEAR